MTSSFKPGERFNKRQTIFFGEAAAFIHWSGIAESLREVRVAADYCGAARLLGDAEKRRRRIVPVLAYSEQIYLYGDIMSAEISAKPGILLSVKRSVSGEVEQIGVSDISVSSGIHSFDH